ncbi:MAG TPA: hypothetical protein P5057_07160, partial [Acidobacteriota bacterium]|nr:hypothetical protein [Acidobacteriota bacterium]
GRDGRPPVRRLRRKEGDRRRLACDYGEAIFPRFALTAETAVFRSGGFATPHASAGHSAGRRIRLRPREFRRSVERGIADLIDGIFKSVRRM